MMRDSVVITVLLIVVAAVTRSSLATLCIALAGYVIALVSVFWRWRTRPYHAVIAQVLYDARPITLIILVISSVVGDAIFVTSGAIFYLQAGDSPCLCQAGSGVNGLLSVSVGLGLAAFGCLVATCAIVVGIWGLYYRARGKTVCSERGSV